MSAIPYWIESTTGKTWLKVPEMLPFETRMFYVKKTAGYAPDIDATMIFGDDWRNQISVDTSKWIVYNGVTVTNGQLVTGSAYTRDDYVHSTITFPNGDYIFECSAKYNSNSIRSYWGMWRRIGNADVAVFDTTNPNANVLNIVTRNNNIQSGASIGTSHVNVSKRWKIVPFPDKVEYYVDDSLIGTMTSNIPDEDMHVSICGYQANGYVYTDWVIIRKYAAVEPTVTVKDCGTFYQISVTNNTPTTLTDFQVAVNSADLGVSSTQESLLILPVHRSEISNVPYNNLFDGCVAYWDFNGDAQDVMGNFNGSTSGAVLTTGRFGVSNSGYTVSGTQYITTNYVLQAPTNTNLFTVLQWVYFDGVNTANVFGSDASATGQFHLDAYIRSTLYGLGRSYFGGTTSDGPDEVPKTPAAGWYLVGVTKTATKTFDVYVNGVKEISGAIRQATTSTKLNFGRAYVNHTVGARIIGESLAFDKALTEEQHRIMYEVMSRFRVYPIMHPRRLLP